MQAINNYDLLFFGIIICSTVLALIRGGISEILSLATWFIAFWLTGHLNGVLERYLPQSISNALVKDIIVFIFIFIVVAVIMAIVKKILATSIAAIGLGGLNYFLGFIFGIIRGLLICTLLVVLIQIFGLNNYSTNKWQNSKLAPVLNAGVSWIMHLLPQKFQQVKISSKTTTSIIDELPKLPAVKPINLKSSN